MNTLKLLLGKTSLCTALATGSALYLVAAPDSEAFSFLGHSLNQSERDFRIFNNFLDAPANDNVTPEANFPGQVGAVLAIWKGAVEWGSRPHGDGTSADDTQPNLGDGGANFDFTFQGLSDEVGGVDSNTHSGITGSLGGVITTTEQDPAGNGWRARYYEDDWTWTDGPASIPQGQMDLQAAACRIHGTALGLGTSQAFLSTMSIGSGPGLTIKRSIEADDIAGIQALYGVASASKPTIGRVTVSGSTVLITGTNFAATGNQVWFTAAGIGTGVPVKVLGLDSTAGGTEIALSAPVGAGDGDVLVRTTTGGAGLSNAWPIDIDGVSPVTVTGTSPDPLPSLTGNNSQTLLLEGTLLSTVTDVRFNGVSLSGIPSKWSLIDNETIAFDLDPLDTYGITALGDYEIEVDSALGTASTLVTVAGASPPALRIGEGGDPELVLSLFPTDITMGGQPGNVMFLWASLNLGFTPFPGLFNLDIGNSDYASISFVAALAVGANGNVTASPNLSSSLAGLTIYWEAVEYDPVLGTLPAETTNAVGSTVLL